MNNNTTDSIPWSRPGNTFLVDENDDIIELARKFAVKCWMGFGCSNRYRNGFRTSQQRASPDTTKQWHDFVSEILLVAERGVERREYIWMNYN